MYVTKTIGPKGQVVIPESVRRILGLKPGAEVLFDVKGEEIIIRPKATPAEFVEKFCSAVKKKAKKKIDLHGLYEKQLEERLFK